ncbi:hypothetical protein NKJ08_04400 [Mesorhizobium sp. M0244]
MGATLTDDGVSKAFGSAEVLKQIAIDGQVGAFVFTTASEGAGNQRYCGCSPASRRKPAVLFRLADELVNHLAPRARNPAMVFQSYDCIRL